jgi:hypothetical protein
MKSAASLAHMPALLVMRRPRWHRRYNEAHDDKGQFAPAEGGGGGGSGAAGTAKGGGEAAGEKAPETPKVKGQTPEVAAATTEAVAKQLGYDEAGSGFGATTAAPAQKAANQVSLGKRVEADASVSTEQLTAFNHDPLMAAGAKGLSSENLSERRAEAELVSRALMSHWAATSGDSSSPAVAVQLVAQKVFGLDIAQTEHLDVTDKAKGLAAKHEAAISATLRATYAATQEELKDAPDHVWLIRGQNGAVSEKSTVMLQPLSSFTTDVKVADMFVSGKKGAVFAIRVPKKSIFSTARTGFGCLHEREVVVLGGAKYTAHRLDLKNNKTFGYQLGLTLHNQSMKKK